jgi:hypothetical protein
MRHRWWVAAIAGLLLAAPCAWGQDGVKFFPLDQVRAGLKGVGRTVFEGDRIDEFQVEILGVLKNALAPKQDLILARLSGGPLEKTGVIAGMSGSPVYVDGKLVGAVARAFPFAKEAIAGITPIGQMVQVVPEAVRASPQSAGHHEQQGCLAASSSQTSKTDVCATPSAGQQTRQSHPAPSRGFRIVLGPGGSWDTARLIPQEDERPPWERLLSATSTTGDGSAVSLQIPGLQLALPLRFGGFSSELIQSYAPVFRALGFEPMAGGILSGSGPEESSKTSPEAGAAIEPGSMVSLFLVRGDLNLNADCTVTYRQGDHIYACGHQLLVAGPLEIPFAHSKVLLTVPSLASSFKIDAPGPSVGSIHQDRFSAIYGVVGDKAAMIPVHFEVDSTLNTKARYNFELIQDAFLSPFLLNITLVSALGSTERMVGPATLQVKGQIHLSTGDSVNLEDVVSGDINAANAASFAVSTPLSHVLSSGFAGLSVKGVDVSVVSLNELRTATLDQVWSTQLEVRPGDHIEVTAVLRMPSGESVTQKIPVDIPESITDKHLTLVVGSGQTINALENRLTPLSAPPRDLRQLVRALNRMRRNNRLYALLMAPQRSFILQGDEYPSPPPSLVQTLMADPTAASSLTFSGTSVVGDFETKPSPYTIRGDKTILLKVVNAGG